MRSKTAFTVKPKKKTSPSAIPFMRETEIASFRMAAFTVGRSLPRNWCGTTCSTFFVRVSFFHWFVGISYFILWVSFIHQRFPTTHLFVCIFHFFPFILLPRFCGMQRCTRGYNLARLLFISLPWLFFLFKFIFLTYPNQHAWILHGTGEVWDPESWLKWVLHLELQNVEKRHILL